MTLQSLIKDFQDFNPRVEDECYIKWTLPVAIGISWSMLTLCIAPTEDGYIISDEGGLFEERMHGGEEYYFKKYCRSKNRCTYGIKVKNGYFYKEYPNNHSPRVAVSDFIRFFIALDDFYHTL